MSLQIGTQLGSVQILALLGRGGMGEVYRARDLKLKREVAIKLLPDEFSRDPDRVARFQREAEVLASLNHPNIAAIYDVREADGSRFLVLELVEGENLAERIKRGPIPIDDALSIAKSICEALEAAHEKGVMHRDLKPANVKITPEGKVKVLDFGLAKAFEPEASSANFSNSPTASMGATRPGVILGTAAYMSPEQARGKTVDKRTDIWAFGVVLFEMLTAAAAFDGETVTDVLGAIVHKEPAWEKLPRDTPPALLRLLRRCLAKDARQRVHDIADARLEIEALLREPDQQVSLAGSADSLQNRRWSLVAVGMVAGILITVVGGLLLQWRSGSSDRTLQEVSSGPLTRTTIDLPANAPLALGTHIPAEGFDNPVLAISPDGKYLAYVGQSGADTMLYVRALGSEEVRPIAGTEGALHPFFSPDGQWIGFLTDNKVKKVSVQGGAVSALSDTGVAPLQGWWSEKNIIYFSDQEGHRLSRVPAEGGASNVVVDLPVNETYAFRQISDLLPDGQRVLVNAIRGIGDDYADVEILSTTGSQRKVLIRSAYGARYVSPGYLIFARSGNLFASRFDAGREELIGQPVPLVVGGSMESLFGQVHAAVSNAFLAYVPGGDRAVGRLAWVDRKGAVEFLEVPERVYGAIDLAPDGKRLAVQVADTTNYIWVYDLQRREGRRLAGTESNGWPVWDPTGSKIAFLSIFKPEGQKILIRTADGDAAPQELPINGYQAFNPVSWAGDGNSLAVAVFERDGAGAIQFTSMDGRAIGKTTARYFASFSPDSRWFADDRNGEIWVRSLPDGKIARQISTDGGIEPLWCTCGELFYRKGNRWFSTKISTSSELRWDPPRLAFETDFIDTPGISYDVSPDGQRLLVVKRAQRDIQTKINVVANWVEAPERK